MVLKRGKILVSIGIFSLALTGCSSTASNPPEPQTPVWPTFPRTGIGSDAAALEGTLFVENGCVKLSTEASSQAVTVIFADDLAVTEFLENQPKIILEGGFTTSSSANEYKLPQQCGSAENFFMAHQISSKS